MFVTLISFLNEKNLKKKGVIITGFYCMLGLGLHTNFG